jgi:hypothetical protein
MYFWCVDENNIDRKIWQTKNGGGTWTQLNDDNITNCGDVFGGCGTQQGTFNLELAAVPDGEVTDLYAGLANLFKCRITTASPVCNGSGADTFLNLRRVSQKRKPRRTRRFTKESPQPCEATRSPPSCTFVSLVVNGFSAPHQITAVTSPNSIDDV